jgi:hypothetical protein
VGKKEYLIKWKGWSHSDNTWEPLIHLLNVEEMITEFELQQINLNMTKPIVKILRKKVHSNMTKQIVKRHRKKVRRKFSTKKKKISQIQSNIKNPII